ncbi:MAG: hypothetical protein WKG52_05125 [Variovorax sp.]
MEKIILYIDDVVHAGECLARLAPPAGGTSQRHWVLVACPPRMTHRISKWVSHSARENWRAKWFAKVQEQLVLPLQRSGDRVTPVLANGALPELTQRLKMEFGAAAQVIDARRPKIGAALEPLAPGQQPPRTGWSLPSVLLGMGTLLTLVNELPE